jgi:hypothetical protein
MSFIALYSHPMSNRGGGALTMTYVSLAELGGDWQEGVEVADRALLHQLLIVLQNLGESHRPRLDAEQEVETEFEVERNDAQHYYTIKVLYPSYVELSYSQLAVLYSMGMTFIDPDHLKVTPSPPDGFLLSLRVHFHDRPVALSVTRITVETTVQVVPVKVRGANDTTARSGEKRARTAFVPDVNGAVPPRTTQFNY